MHYPADPDAGQGLPFTIRTGESQLIPTVTDEMLEVGQIAQDEEHARILRELGFRSALVVPLRARGRILGRDRARPRRRERRAVTGPRT